MKIRIHGDSQAIYTTPTRESIRLVGKSKFQRFFMRFWWWIRGRGIQ